MTALALVRSARDISVMTEGDFRLGLTAVFEPAAEGGFTCFFEELPEVFSEGETIAEARGNLYDALQEVFAYHREEARKRSSAEAVRETMELAAS